MVKIMENPYKNGWPHFSKFMIPNNAPFKQTSVFQSSILSLAQQKEREKRFAIQSG